MVRQGLPPGHFHSAHGFVTRELAYMLDSLVRVSRRVEWTLFVSILRHFPSLHSRARN